MGAAEADVISHIDSCGVDYTLHQHEAVATVDAQVTALAGVEGLPIKNLFLKDKKHRFYVASTLPDSKIDLKVLSARLGLGKGGISMAPEAALGEVLQVPLGSVTPLCICNSSAEHVILLLDERIKSQSRVLVHPCVNTSSVGLTPTALETVLRKFRSEIHYVDFNADVKVDKDNPPDLKPIVEAADARKPAVTEAKPGAPVAPAAAAAAAPASAPATAAKAKSKAAEKSSSAKPQKAGGAVKGGVSAVTLSLAALSTEDIINKVALALTGKSIGEVDLEPYVKQRLHGDVEMQLNALRNTAYASGYVAGKGELVAHGQGRYA